VRTIRATRTKYSPRQLIARRTFDITAKDAPSSVNILTCRKRVAGEKPAASDDARLPNHHLSGRGATARPIAAVSSTWPAAAVPRIRMTTRAAVRAASRYAPVARYRAERDLAEAALRRSEDASGL
jgi:hypothetical protein